MRMISWEKWAPLKLIIRTLPRASSLGSRGRSYLKSRGSKIRDRILRRTGDARVPVRPLYVHRNEARRRDPRHKREEMTLMIDLTENQMLGMARIAGLHIPVEDVVPLTLRLNALLE